MRRFILSFIVLLAAVWIGLKIAADPGYVLLAYQQWTVEMPLWFGAGVIIVFVLLLHYGLRFIRAIGFLPQRFREWSGRRRDQYALRLTNEGFEAAAMGDWALSEKKFIKAQKGDDLSWINYIEAAKAANEQNAFERRDNYLRSALKIAPKTEVIVGIYQATFQLAQRQFEQAQATLRRLLALAPKQKYIVEWLANVCVELKDWDELLDLIARAQKYKILSPEKITQFQQKAYQAQLAKIASQTTHFEVIQNVWQRIPKNLQHDSALLSDYASYLAATGGAEIAEQLLRKEINRQWDEQLVLTYGLIVGPRPDKQLSYAEDWLPSHKQDAALLLTLGRLCIQNQLWGKARSYLESSLAQKPVPETYVALANLFEKLNDKDAAFQHYKKGLTLD